MLNTRAEFYKNTNGESVVDDDRYTHTMPHIFKLTVDWEPEGQKTKSETVLKLGKRVSAEIDCVTVVLWKHWRSPCAVW